MNRTKPNLRKADIWNMSMGFLGIQMGFALQNANASRILQTFGADVEHLSWFWLVAPITGMIVQPIVGHYSDNTWTRLGRRRPYFLAGAVLASLGLILMPNAGLFAAFIPALSAGLFSPTLATSAPIGFFKFSTSAISLVTSCILTPNQPLLVSPYLIS